MVVLCVFIYLKEVQRNVEGDDFREEECQTDDHSKLAVQGTRYDEQGCPMEKR